MEAREPEASLLQGFAKLSAFSGTNAQSTSHAELSQMFNNCKCSMQKACARARAQART
eukprot:CAMPEP_0171139484 /NCGR_PEP_ID=MMETSP0766_2-20121228/136971_1 /TAXON_ID=439317 /ORGANISM="Gambierdiscus australes, Strain CAWD 149" /LENGTH=57 /DNA_ID=CAMNT_0011603147 /DNA_START=47 /DNA_END=216 /DNA_ORIENTATION=-